MEREPAREPDTNVCRAPGRGGWQMTASGLSGWWNLRVWVFRRTGVFQLEKNCLSAAMGAMKDTRSAPGLCGMWGVGGGKTTAS